MIYHLQNVNKSQLERIPTIKKITSNNVFIVTIVIVEQLDTNIHVNDPNRNYEILKHTLKETHSEGFLNVELNLMTKKT